VRRKEHINIERTLGDVGSALRGDERVGVSGVADNKHLDGLGRHGVQVLALHTAAIATSRHALHLHLHPHPRPLSHCTQPLGLGMCAASAGGILRGVIWRTGLKSLGHDEHNEHNTSTPAP